MNNERQPLEDRNETDRSDANEPMPASGPHGKPELTNRDATPGAGSLPTDEKGGESDAGVG